jgi:hypothetical protein
MNLKRTILGALGGGFAGFGYLQIMKMGGG